MDARKSSWLLLSVLLFLFVLGNKPHDSIASDTISLGKSLTGDQTIISSGGIFELGFFKPGESNNYYIGIWYKKVSVQTVVWVANRNKPISNISYSEFKLIENGNLVVYQSKSSIWSTNIASDTSNTTEAVLGDDGNLVVRDGSNPSVVYWQSFEYPTDTWLPGGKVGFNKINKTQLLTSWRSPEDPDEGIFNLELDPSGTNQYLIIWNRSVRVWTTGEWNEAAKAFTLVPEMRLNYIYNYSYISNENESYFTYNLYNNSIISRLVMDFSGQIKQFTWSYTTQRWNMFWSQPNKFCDVYGICGRFGNCNQDVLKCECLPGFVTRSPTNWNFQDPTGGCVNNKFSECGPIDWLQDYTDGFDGCARNATLQCGSKDWFLPIPASNLPDTPQSPQVNSAEECKSACESTCSCNAYAYTDAGCKLWEGDLFNVKQESDGRAGNLYLRRAASEISSPIPIAQVRKRKVIIWKIIIPVFTLVATIMGVLGYIYLFKRSKVNEGGRLKELQQVLADLLKSKATYNDTPNTNMLGKSEEETQELQIFKLACLSTATNNFCLKTKLGEGGFGPVYKGILQNGQEIAVKRLSKSSGQGIEEFKNEVVLISKLQHRNLVKLLGCCVEGEENMLIYEFMPNKSLDAFLFGRKPHLDWEKRFNIIGGIARGLLYLHRDSRLRVIHRDLKVSNILLDEDMNPKISDFGMARIFCGNQIIASTSRVVGTFGYMSPEYIMGGTFSEKSDVFSFGVLILEIVSSKKNNSFYNPEQPLNLLLHTWRLWNEGRWNEVIDEALGDIYSPSEVKKCVHIGLLCVQNRAVDRPTMAEVDFMLISETDPPSPKEPPYSFPVLSNEPGFLPIRCSNNNVTLTTVEGR